MLAFRIADRVLEAITIERYHLRLSALCDPASGRYAAFDGAIYRDEPTFVAAMKFLAEAPGPVETVAH